MNIRSHGAVRSQQPCIPPLVAQWLDQFGEEKYDGHGGVLLYFSRASIRASERARERAPVRKLAEYFDVHG